MTVVQHELQIVVGAYLLAALPMAAIVLAGRMSPVYRLPREHLCRWWSRFALVIVALALLISAVGYTG
jgi:hypothetical protein